MADESQEKKNICHFAKWTQVLSLIRLPESYEDVTEDERNEWISAYSSLAEKVKRRFFLIRWTMNIVILCLGLIAFVGAFSYHIYGEFYNISLSQLILLSFLPMIIIVIFGTIMLMNYIHDTIEQQLQANRKLDDGKNE